MKRRKGTTDSVAAVTDTCVLEMFSTQGLESRHHSFHFT